MGELVSTVSLSTRCAGGFCLFQSYPHGELLVRERDIQGLESELSFLASSRNICRGSALESLPHLNSFYSQL